MYPERSKYSSKTKSPLKKGMLSPLFKQENNEDTQTPSKVKITNNCFKHAQGCRQRSMQFQGKNFSNKDNFQITTYLMEQKQAQKEFYEKQISLLGQALRTMDKDRLKKYEQLKESEGNKTQRLSKNKVDNHSSEAHENQLKNYYLIQMQKMKYEHERKLKEIQKERIIQRQLSKNKYEQIIESLRSKYNKLENQKQRLLKEFNQLQNILCQANEKVQKDYSINMINDTRYTCQRFENVQGNRVDYQQFLEVNSLKFQLSNLKEENAMLRSFINAKQHLIENQSWQKKDNAQKQEYEKQLRQLIMQKQQIHQQLLMLKIKQQKRIKDIQTAYEIRINGMQAEISHFKHKIKQLQDEYMLKTSKMEQQCKYQLKKSTILYQSSEKKQKLMLSQDSMRNSNKNNFEQAEKIEFHYKSIVGEKDKEIHELRHQLSDRKNNQIRYHRQIQTLHQQKLNLAQEKSKRQNSINILRHQITNLKQRYSEKQKGLLSRIQQIEKDNHNQINQQSHKLQEQLHSKNQRIRCIEQEKVFIQLQSKTCIERLQSELEIIQQNYKQSLKQKEEIMMELNEKILQKQNIEEKYSMIKVESQKKSAYINKFEAENEERLQLLEIENCDLKAKEEIYQIEKQRNYKYISQLEESQLKTIKLTAYIQELQVKVQKQEQKIANIQSQKYEKSEQIHIIEQQCRLLNEKNLSLQKSLQQIKAKKQEQTAALQQLNQQIQISIQENAHKLKVLVQQKQKLIKQQQQIFRTEYNQLQSKYNQLKQQQQNYILQLADMKEKTSKLQKSIKINEIQLKQAKEYIFLITTENQQLHDNINSIYGFFNVKCAEIKQYSEKAIEKSYSFKKVKVQEIMSEHQQIMIANSSQVITMPDFSEKKQILEAQPRHTTNQQGETIQYMVNQNEKEEEKQKEKKSGSDSKDNKRQK